MTAENSRDALRQMLTAWGRCVGRHPEKSPVGEQALMTLVTRCEARLERGATAADVLLLEVVPFFETADEVVS